MSDRFWLVFTKSTSKSFDNKLSGKLISESPHIYKILDMEQKFLSGVLITHFTFAEGHFR